jgi:hypothetical protein
MEDIQKLEAIINARLDETENSDQFPIVGQMIKTPTGRKRIFERVKEMIMFEGFEDIESCLNSIENSL